MNGINPVGIARVVSAAQEARPQIIKLKKATDGFEAVFVKQLLESMRRGTKTTQFGDTLGGDIYKDMFDQSLADSLSSKGVLGFGQMLFRPMATRVIEQAMTEQMQRFKRSQMVPIIANDTNAKSLDGNEQLPGDPE